MKLATSPDVLGGTSLKIPTNLNTVKHRVKQYLLNLIHGSECEDKNCKEPYCLDIKQFISHINNCTTKTAGGCENCTTLAKIICFHSIFCTDKNCLLVFCAGTKNTLKGRGVHDLDQARKNPIDKLNENLEADCTTTSIAQKPLVNISTESTSVSESPQNVLLNSDQESNTIHNNSRLAHIENRMTLRSKSPRKLRCLIEQLRHQKSSMYRSSQFCQCRHRIERLRHHRKLNTIYHKCSICKSAVNEFIYRCYDCGHFYMCQNCKGDQGHPHNMTKIRADEAGPSEEEQKIEHMLQENLSKNIYYEQLQVGEGKNVVSHIKGCKKKIIGGCRACKMVVDGCLSHAKNCNSVECCIPFCEKGKRLLQLRQLELSLQEKILNDINNLSTDFDNLTTDI